MFEKNKTMSKEKENSRVVRYIIFPMMVSAFIGFFIIPEARIPFALYFGLALWSLVAYRQKDYKEEVYGIRGNVFLQYLGGVGIGIGFLILTGIMPFFSLLTPTLSMSIISQVRWYIIVIMAPLLEEPFRSATKAYIEDIYKISFGKANFFQAVIFALLHVLVYGIGLSAYDKWVQVYGAVLAIGGSLFAAFFFGIISGIMMKKFKSVVPSIGAHQTINFFLWTKGLIAVVI